MMEGMFHCRRPDVTIREHPLHQISRKLATRNAFFTLFAAHPPPHSLPPPSKQSIFKQVTAGQY